MKKKKLKKEIEELHKEITRQREMISTLSDKYIDAGARITKLTIKCNEMENTTNDLNYILNHMTVKDIIHWCATHPDPEKKKQYEEELSRAMKMYFQNNESDNVGREE